MMSPNNSGDVASPIWTAQWSRSNRLTYHTRTTAAFVRADDLRVERLEQTYTRLDDGVHFAYTSMTFSFACNLAYDTSGLIVDYPGIATRLTG